LFAPFEQQLDALQQIFPYRVGVIE